jgi:hypothetical protein
MIAGCQAAGEPVDGALRNRFERLVQGAGGLRLRVESGEFLGKPGLGPHVHARGAVTGAIEDPAALFARGSQLRFGIGFRGRNGDSRLALDLEHAIHRVCNGHVWLRVRHRGGSAA